ncbi:MAG: hypothetical protein WAN23_19035 [Candidatus Acidiferrales bacterium]
MKKHIVRLAVGSVLAIAFTLSAAHVTLGDVRDDCRRKLEADRARIDRDAAKHGDHSRQVDKDIDRMDADRNWCREHHADWDHDRFDVGIYIRR